MADSAAQQFFGRVNGGNTLAGNSFSGNNHFIFPERSNNSGAPQTDKHACLRSLGFGEMHSRQKDIVPAEPNTCDWLFETSQFIEWRNPALLRKHHGVLWIKGNPGVGKSTLMKHALLRYQKKFFQDHFIVAYFFNARGCKLEKSPLGLFRSIVYQLVERDDELYRLCEPVFREKQMFKTDSNLWWDSSELQDFVRLVVRERACARPLLLLVDALDECDVTDVRDVVQFLESLSVQALQSGFQLRICLSSRHYPNVRMAKFVELVVEKNSAHQTDIITYIRERLRSPDDAIQVKIANRANGIFLWVVIVVSLLNKTYDEGRIEEMHKALVHIPDGLEKVFSRIVATPDDIAETLCVLQWVLLSQRPLSFKELFAAVTPDRVRQGAALDNELIQRRITTLSNGLVEMRNDDSDQVQFIHLSVRDFLLRRQRLRTLDPTLGVDPIVASHGRLWARCQLSIEQAITSTRDDDSMREALHKDPFLNYAASHILDHAERAISSLAWRDVPNSQQTSETDLCCLADSPQHINIRQWLHRSDRWFGWWKRFLTICGCSSEERYKFGHKSGTGFNHILARREFLNLLRASLVGTDIDAQDDEQETVLYAVCHLNKPKVEMVKLLLDAGANVNVQGGRFGNALQAAAYSESLELVQLLLDAGADVNAQGGRFGNALQAAAYSESLELVRLLLDVGANVNTQGGEYGNALQAAAYSGSLELVQLLLDAGANVNAQGGKYGNALQAAAYCNSLKVVRLLLDVGANVNTEGGEYGNALQAAAYSESLELVQLLLDAGADVNAQGGYFGNALQAAAAYSESPELVRLLLDVGADVNAQGGYYGNALQAVCHSSDPEREIIEVLLAAGADRDLVELDDLSPGKQEIIKRLFEQSVEVSYASDWPEEAASTENRRSWVSQIICGCLLPRSRNGYISL